MNRLVIASLVAFWGWAVASALWSYIAESSLIPLAVSGLIAGMITAPLFLKDVARPMLWSVLGAIVATILGAEFFALWSAIDQGLDTEFGRLFALPVLVAVILAQSPIALLIWLAGGLMIHSVGRVIVHGRRPSK